MDKIRFNIIIFIGLVVRFNSMAQLPVPSDIGGHHPRCFGKNMDVESVQQLVDNEGWAAQILTKTHNKVDKYIAYCEDEPDWLLSRLQMYWNSKHTDIYINGGVFSHAEGEAPVPTVRYPGTRDHRSDYCRPKLEELLPYSDDPRGLFYFHKERKQKEWASVAATARNLESVNREILGIARDAAFLFWLTNEEKYVRLAFGILDTYLMGLYYRNEPIDLSHGHHQTLVGLTSFEVIQEHWIAEVTQTYDFLYNYIKVNHQDKLDIYYRTFQKWADQVIKNGVSFNNWNLFQAGHVSRIALVLENNGDYKNGKGAQYYLDQVMNQSSARQWSITKMLEYGYDYETGIWCESPSYSIGVLRDFVHFAEFYDRNFDIDLVKELPVLRQAVVSSVQYLYPNGFMVNFGDGHYKKIEAGPLLYMIENAQKFDKIEDEIYFTRMLKTFFDEDVYSGKYKVSKIGDLFADEPLKIKEDIPAGNMSDFTSPLFYAPNTSWLVQRTGQDKKGLMISQIGSLGNHMHSNGIAMELYGYGLPLAPEMGHGSSYFSIEYAEYYTQFPAHNTVIVNGKSKYPEMKSNHPFSVNANYPKSGRANSILDGISFSDLSFLEPETNSDQRRVMGIISDSLSGYYFDIFRSKQKEGKDIKHEYFYHNLGQDVTLTDQSGTPLDMQSTEKMAFGDGDLMAYDYIWDKKSIVTDENVTGKFNLNLDDKTVYMNVWVRGEEEREVFTALSPKCSAFHHGPIPEKFNNLPIPTLVLRQEGEAWNRPFVAVYEPALNSTSEIEQVDYFGSESQVGIFVKSISGRKDFILSNPDDNKIFTHNEIELQGNFAIVSENGNNLKILLGEGKVLSYKNYTLSTEESSNATFEVIDNIWYISTSIPLHFKISISDVRTKYQLIFDSNVINGKIDKKAKKVSFRLPATHRTQVKIEQD